MRAELARQELERTSDGNGRAEGPSFPRLIGSSQGLRDVLERAARIIPVPVPVLITGETGTGKDLLAQAIHFEGPRASGPFVDVNCAALPATLLESELFGVEKGAYTDAKAAKAGLFESAHTGTLFLDEIGDLPLDLQAKILKVLEDKRVRRIGSVRVRELDVRILAATHVDLRQRVRAGTFRQDLFFRLAVLPLHIPPLRARGDDVLVIAEHFLALYAEQYRRKPPRMTTEFRAALLRHPWPGNVRELAHAINRAILLSGDVLEPSVLELDHGFVEPAPGRDSALRLSWPCTMSEAETAIAAAALERTGGNKVRASELLGISRNRLRRLLDDPSVPSADDPAGEPGAE
jgi:two-component system response regulator HydG